LKNNNPFEKEKVIVIVTRYVNKLKRGAGLLKKIQKRIVREILNITKRNFFISYTMTVRIVEKEIIRRCTNLEVFHPLLYKHVTHDVTQTASIRRC